MTKLKIKKPNIKPDWANFFLNYNLTYLGCDAENGSLYLTLKENPDNTTRSQIESDILSLDRSIIWSDEADYVGIFNGEV